MPMGLLDLPEEVLNACIGELLPPLRENGPEWIVDCETSLRTFPVDILTLRLACSLLYRLATPWVWRRLDIHLDRHILERAERPSHSHPIALHKWTALLDQPEVVKHVRFFSLRSSQIPDDELRPALAALIPLVRMMHKLRVVRLQVFTMDDAAEAKEISSTLFADLLSKPELHTSILRCMAIPPHSALRSLANVKRLFISDYTWLESILPITPRLEVLSFCGPLDSNSNSLPVPWNTLRELETRQVDHWTPVLDNYTAWKERNPTECSPLSELFISGVLLNADSIRHILSVFSEQQLTKLNLWGKVYMDIPILRSLLTTFPRMEDLNLITYMFNVDWETELSDISEIFGQCPALKVFRCSHPIGEGFSVADSDEEEGSIESPSGITRSKFAKIVASLGKNTRSLNHVQFFDRYDESYPFDIERDGQGDYETSYLVRLPNDLTHRINCLHTSGWRLKNFNYL